LHQGLRAAYLLAAILLLLITPYGQASVLLVLFVAVDLAAAALMLRPEPAKAETVVAIRGDRANLALLRRTVPELRMRRPGATIEAQVQWRQTAQIHRERRDVFFRSAR
jgi:hypothetical protein